MRVNLNLSESKFKSSKFEGIVQTLPPQIKKKQRDVSITTPESP